MLLTNRRNQVGGQPLSTGVDLIAGATVWMESDATDQLERLATMPGFVRAVGLPDLHPGAGTPIGAVLATEGHLHPTLLGSDAGCGVLLWPTRVKRFNPDRLEKRVRAAMAGPVPFDSELIRREAGGLDVLGPDEELGQAARSLGSLGSGNHFAEVARVAAIVDRGAAERLGLVQGALVVLVHTGSRRVGRVLGLRWARRVAEGRSFDAPEERRRVLEELDVARRFAWENRRVVGEVMLRAAGAAGAGRRGEAVDSPHNDVSAEEVEGRRCWVHRKGASHAHAGQPGVVLGTRGSPSWVVVGRGSGRSLESMAHGAGRRMNRGEAVAKLRPKHTREKAKRSATGGRLVYARKEQLWEEHPDAYKAIGPVIDSLVEADVVSPVARLEPVITVKQ